MDLPAKLGLKPTISPTEKTAVVCTIRNGARDKEVAELSILEMEKLGKTLLRRAQVLRELAVMTGEVEVADRLRALHAAAIAADQADIADAAKGRLDAKVKEFNWPASPDHGSSKTIDLACLRSTTRQADDIPCYRCRPGGVDVDMGEEYTLTQCSRCDSDDPADTMLRSRQTELKLADFG